jgi:heat shock protein HtpX
MYELIKKNKRKSWFVFFGMGLLLLTLGGAIGYLVEPSEMGLIAGIAIASCLWAILALVAMTNGAKVIMQGMNARQITMQDDTVLHNVIEELSQVSDLPMPKIYLIETPALNAFAAGIKPQHSVVAITRGLREKLTRQEMQAVMAHEMSHIYNRDVMYMTFASVMLCTIVIISNLLVRSFLWSGGGRSRSRSSKGGNSGAAQLIIIAAVILLAILAPLFAQLFYFSLSRKREYLADTMAVNFTRDPESLANALAKISGDSEKFDPGKMAAAMCINKPKLRGHKESRFSTHPPIQKRIAILRAMSMGTDYASYCSAYQEVMGRNDLMK